MTDDAMAKRNQQITTTAGDFPGREYQQSLDGPCCLFAGAVPPVMARARPADDLCNQLHRREP